MIVPNVTYRCKPGMREAFLERIMAEGIDAACREEAGNLQYAYYLSTDDDDELLLVEKWRDADALAEHRRQPHLIRSGMIKPEYMTKTLMETYEV